VSARRTHSPPCGEHKTPGADGRKDYAAAAHGSFAAAKIGHHFWKVAGSLPSMPFVRGSAVVVVADTDVLIDAFDKEREPMRTRVLTLAQSGELATTAVTLYELTASARRNDRSASRAQEAEPAYRGANGRAAPTSSVPGRDAHAATRPREGARLRGLLGDGRRRAERREPKSRRLRAMALALLA
jgi:hypothetical protein